ncbi:MAG TPA: recombinase RecT [Candidatus Limnocylindrales bacterium]|nr:recombinase RecT [Candidatus Limnocylindrales bacterium]
MATAQRPKNEQRAVTVRPEQQALQALDAELERRRSVVEASAASLIDPQRLKAVVLSQFTRTPALWDCEPVSIARSVVEAAQMGLEPTGAIGGAHLVPFRNSKTGKTEAQLIIDYRGYVQLARRSGEVSKVWARVVREKDEFYVEAGTDDELHHRPYLGQDDPGNVTHVYAVIRYRDGSQQFDWDTRAWVESIRKRSKAADKGPWVTDWAEMAKKSILRRLLKTAPLTVEARRAIEMEEQAEAEVAQHRSGRPSGAVAAIRERLGVRTPEPDVVEGEAADVTEAADAATGTAASGDAEPPVEEAESVPPAGSAALVEEAQREFAGELVDAPDPDVQAGLELLPPDKRKKGGQHV